MPLPDVHCWVKLVSSDKVISDGSQMNEGTTVAVRYVVANDSHVPAGPLTVVGALYQDETKIVSPGVPNVVPAQQITVQPNAIWKKEFVVKDNGTYRAKMIVDVGNFVNEEDENNNVAQTTFSIRKPVQ